MSKRILIIDDDEQDLLLINEWLSRYDWTSECISASDAGQALEYIPCYNFDLAIVDVNMPNINGIETCKKIRKMDKNIKILLVSGADLNMKDKEILKSQADLFSSKSSLESDLEEIFNKLNN